jgi:FkbM family methyltransferase
MALMNRQLAEWIDYSQHGQGLIIEQLITPDTPRSVIDIGAHDGLLGSNSRRLIEQGWYGILVEPVPSVFRSLEKNYSGFQSVRLIQAACSDKKGTAHIQIGRDGAQGQMSSLSKDPMIAGNLSTQAVEVQTTTLPDLIAENQISEDFGILLVDTEGWDFAVLKTLERTTARPRIIVTEEFAPTNCDKYHFLTRLNYRFVGVWGSDSFWVSAGHPAQVTSVQLPIVRLPDNWIPPGRPISKGRTNIDFNPFSPNCLTGWICNPEAQTVEPNVAVILERVASPQRYRFLAWRTPRPDVAEVFKSDDLLMAGYRAAIDVPSGVYDVRVVQFGNGVYDELNAGKLSFQMPEVRPQ